MQCIQYHFPPINFTPYHIRDIQYRQKIYHSWKNYFKNTGNKNPSEYFIKYWYLLDKKVQTGKLCISLHNEDLSLELMSAVEFLDDFCVWLPPHEDTIELH